MPAFTRELLYSPLLVDRIDFQMQGQTTLDFDLAGNRLQVELPLPFSKDMPPTKLTPEFDLHDPQAFGDARKRALLKAMWDFPRPRFWQPDYGSATMAIWVHKNPNPERYDLFKRDHFVSAIQDDLKAEYDPYNQHTWEEGLAAGRLSIDVGDDLISFGRNTDERFTDHKFNGSRWLSHFIIGAETHTHYCTPIDAGHYVSLDFEFMPSLGVYASEMPGMLEHFMTQILSSTRLSHEQDGHENANLKIGMTLDASSI